MRKAPGCGRNPGEGNLLVALWSPPRVVVIPDRRAAAAAHWARGYTFLSVQFFSSLPLVVEGSSSMEPGSCGAAVSLRLLLRPLPRTATAFTSRTQVYFFFKKETRKR